MKRSHLLPATIILFLVWMFGHSAFAAPPVSKGEFLSGINDGSVEMDGRQSYLNPKSEFMIRQLKMLKMTIPEFTESMYGLFYKIRSGYQYSIAYNWETKQCWFEINKLTGEGTIDVKAGAIEQSVIPVRICEKIYGFKAR